MRMTLFHIICLWFEKDTNQVFVAIAEVESEVRLGDVN